MANTVNQLNYANTFADWMVVTNAIGVETNVLGKGDYKKDTGTLYLNETTQNSLQSNGTAVFQKEIRSQGVGSSVTIQNDLTVTSGQVYFSNTTLGLTNAGQANINGLLVAQGPNTSLYVANNSVTGGNKIVRYNTTTNNLKANVNIDTVRLSSSENITTAHLQANTDILTGSLVANTSIETESLTVTGTTLDATNADARFNSASITGNFIVNGAVVYNTPILTVSAESPNQDSYLGTYRTGVGSPTANAYLRWNESQGYWDATANSTSGTYYRVLTNEHLSNAADSSSTTTVATSAAVNTANTYLRTYTNTANTAMKSYVDSANNYVVNYVNTQVTANVLNSGAAVVVAQNYSSTTTDSDPGNGTFRFNNATIGSATFAYMDNLDAYGATITSILSTYGDSTNTVKGHLRFSVYGASTTKFAVFAITSSTAATGYYKIGLTYVSGAGTFTSGDLVMVQYSRAGNVGAQGAQGYQGVQGAQGYQGVQGAQGYQGVQGAQGYQGVQGAQGYQGVQGSQGYQGVQGAQGFQGVAGGFTTGSNAQVNSLGVNTAASGTAGEIRATGDITAGYSDERLKIVEGVIQDPLNKITSLDGVYYTVNDIARSYGYQSAARQVGLLAQQVNKILPEVTPLAPFDTDENGASKSGENYMTIQYEKLVPLLVESIKQLNREVETLKKDVETLKNNK